MSEEYWSANNPPAFPNQADNTRTYQIYDGMSLRDYFAAKAMAAEISGWEVDIIPHTTEIAQRAYQMADSMLAEREKRS